MPTSTTAFQPRACTCSDADISEMTAFLLQTYALNQTFHNWEPRRWIGRLYHRSDADRAAYCAKLPHIVMRWYADGQLVGATTPEYDGGLFLQIHPDYRPLESEMLDWAEAHLAQTDPDGNRWLEVWAYDYDTARNDLLTRRGYTRADEYEVLRRRDMALPITDIALPEGYTVRAMRPTPDDWAHKAALLNAAFRRTFHNPEESRNFQAAPHYRADLDMVVEAPDGTWAATAGFMVHEQESVGVLEPVCTHPNHEGRKLAQAAIAEGLRRVQAIGIRAVFVGAWHSNPVSNHTYEKLGFIDPAHNTLWRRAWK